MKSANLVILQVPKTGTTALEQALRPYATVAFSASSAHKHMTLDQYLRHFNPLIVEEAAQQPDIAICIREPISWLNSWYRYRQRDDLPQHSANSTRAVSFQEFVEAYLTTPVPAFADVGCQAYYFHSKLRHQNVIRFKYETLGSFQRFIEDRLNKALNIPQVNVSPLGDGYLDSVLKERVLEKLHTDHHAWVTARDN